MDGIPTATDWKPKRGEVSAATELIDAMTRDFDPSSYEDRYRVRLQKLVDSKAKGKGKGKDPGLDEADEEQAAQPAPDLMAALRQSLAKARQGSETNTSRQPSQQK
jgi:DNA end-binding protein Ku